MNAVIGRDRLDLASISTLHLDRDGALGIIAGSLAPWRAASIAITQRASLRECLYAGRIEAARVRVEEGLRARDGLRLAPALVERLDRERLALLQHPASGEARADLLELRERARGVAAAKRDARVAHHAGLL